MPFLAIPAIKWAGVVLLGGTGIKLAGDGIESISDASIKMGGALLLGVAAYLAFKGGK
jgi:hypothetical protein